MITSPNPWLRIKCYLEPSNLFLRLFQCLVGFAMLAGHPLQVILQLVSLSLNLVLLQTHLAQVSLKMPRCFCENTFVDFLKKYFVDL